MCVCTFGSWIRRLRRRVFSVWGFSSIFRVEFSWGSFSTHCKAQASEEGRRRARGPRRFVFAVHFGVYARRLPSFLSFPILWCAIVFDDLAFSPGHYYFYLQLSFSALRSTPFFFLPVLLLLLSVLVPFAASQTMFLLYPPLLAL